MRLSVAPALSTILILTLQAVAQVPAPAPSQPRMQAPNIELSDATKKQVCETAAYAIRKAYVLRDKADSFADEVGKLCASDAYKGLARREFQHKFTEDIRAITHDKHMYILVMKKLEDTPLSTKATIDQTIADLSKTYGHGAEPFTPAAPLAANSDLSSYGITSVKRLDGNIGYISFAMFPDIGEAAPAAEAAMKAVSGSKALIFDLRDMKGGGSQELVNLFSSYVMRDPHQHLLTLSVPAVNSNDAQYTYAKLSGERQPDIPVYVLTNNKTFSAGEAFSYILQQSGRATVVGETTGGGGHINEFFSLGQGMAISVAIGEAIEPHSKKGWEGTGVVPDVTVPSADALDTALKLIDEKPRQKS